MSRQSPTSSESQDEAEESSSDFVEQLIKSSSSENFSDYHFVSINDENLVPIISSGNSVLHAQVLREVHQEINAPLIHFGPWMTREEAIDVGIEWLARTGAITFSSAGIVFFGLTLNDKSLSRIGRFPFATAALLANAAQIIVAGEIALNRNLNYLRHFLTALSRGKSGIAKLLHDKTAAIKFILRENIKWTLVYFVSMMASSLALQVDWLKNSDGFIDFIHVAIMLLLEPAIHDRMNDFRLPKLTKKQILIGERELFRTAFNRILAHNEDYARSHLHATPTRNLIDAIAAQDYLGLTSKILAPGRRYVDRLLSDQVFYLGSTITIFLAIIYFLSNTGSYIQTVETASALAANGTILGDTCFGFFAALRCGMRLAHIITQMNSFLRNEWRKVLLAGLGIVIASLTIGSTLAPNQAANMPWLVIFLGIFGTIFENANFLTELFIALENKVALHKKNNTEPRHQTAVITHFYDTLQTTYDRKSDAEFIAYLHNIVHADLTFLASYEFYLYKILPWAKGLSLTQIIDTLAKEPDEAMLVIDRSGRFGSARRLAEFSGSITAALIIGLGFIPIEQVTFIILSRYIVPLAAIPLGLITTGLFSPQHRQGENETVPLQTPSHVTTIDESYTPSGSSTCTAVISHTTKTILGGGLVLALKLGIQFASAWIFYNIFQQSAEDAAQWSEYTANAASMLSAGILTQKISVSMR